MINNQEIILFNKLKEGDKSAFNEIFRMYYKPLCRYCFQFVYDKDTTEEIIQEFFIRLWEQAQSIVIEKSLVAYLYVSVENQITKAFHKLREILKPLFEQLLT